jgi:hypothetical protein
VDTALALAGDPRALAVQQFALLSGPATIVAGGAQSSSGRTVSAPANSSPSQERLVRIAAMIRDAERAMPGRTRHDRRDPDTGAVWMWARRPSRTPARARSAA